MAVGPTKVDTRTWKWTAIAAEDGTAHKVNDSTTMLRFQIIGTFGGTLTMQGSMDNSTWTALADINGNSIAKTAAAFESSFDVPKYVRPSGGAGVTAVDVWMVEVF